ncbi:MAG: hypothetical protein ACLFRJ_00735 [Ectothiorhodospira sp.]
MILRNIIIFLALAIPFFGLSYWLTAPPSSPVHEDLPWDVETLPDGGSRVFGVTLGETPVETLSERLRTRPRLELWGDAQGTHQLVALFEGVRLGPFQVDLVAVLDMPEAGLIRMAGEVVGDSPTSGLGRWALPKARIPQVMDRPVRVLTYAPRAQYTEQTVLERFGKPEKRLDTSDGRYFLYPGRGLALLGMEDGRATLYYVPPRDFGALRQRIQDGQSPVRGVP